MAYLNQSNAIYITGPQFIDPRTVVHPIAVVNPSFWHTVPVPNHPLGFHLNPASLIRMDEQRTRSLIQLMVKEGLVPCPEEEMKRRDVIARLKQIVLAWIKQVAWGHQLPERQIASAGATILTYGSYGLGVHGSDSDIDALCVGPCYATMAEDFFVVLRNMLQSRPEVSELHCVKSAKVPLMRFKYNGFSIDLPYARFPVISVPDNVDLLSPLLQNIDETSWRSLSGVRVNMRILQLVPNLENFQSMLRCVKLWARRRGVYSHLLGFFGGIHLAILAAFICQRHPNASVNILILKFFETFACWPWPRPVILQDGSLPWREFTDGRSFMPIRMPCSPYEFCNSNITRSTFNKIRAEFRRGNILTRDIGRPDFEWSSLFDPFPYTQTYTRFICIFLSAPSNDELQDWLGWVKSRFRGLVLKLEEMQGFCDPNPTEYVDHNVAEPNSVFYWGISPSQSNFTDIDSVKEEFMKSVNNGFQGPCCRLELSIVESSQLPKHMQINSENSEGLKPSWGILDYSQQRRPVYSQYLPGYSVGYVAADGDKYINGGG
eukprot:TRINITY_DN4881_c0_g2_i1.p1 TRINITY_DN4881_c0_g2~~TRINITY_DN4881_c0_g2_i1.p1  ORF type:complete len:547 (-),score=58.95 TRINITY_DN4881_c0_g2_i1:310-1950(-)